MRTLLLATQNVGKKEEFQALFKEDEAIRLITLSEVGIVTQADEVGSTFMHNAQIKAWDAYQKTGIWTLAEDSGLEVDALQGAPGIHSAEYAGFPRSDANNIHRLLKEIKELPVNQRRARFRCALFLQGPSWEIQEEGVCEGTISFQPTGNNGFGYDSIFMPLETEWTLVEEPRFHGCTLAQVPLAAKNKLSHRARAVAAMKSKWLSVKNLDDGSHSS